VSAINPFHWLTMVGALLIAVVIVAPRGVSGLFDKLWSRAEREGKA
jgi:branched-chain amino acid transport system permease protein